MWWASSVDLKEPGGRKKGRPPTGAGRRALRPSNSCDNLRWRQGFRLMSAILALSLARRGPQLARGDVYARE